MSKLALFGGKPVRTRPFPPYNSIGKEEKRAAMSVLSSGVLSAFLGSYGDKFLGGPQVRAFEQEWQDYFKIDYAVTVNSATSGLNMAIGALQLSPGDEVIVSPYTMSASATCAAVYGGVPVFADVEPEYFCLDPKDIERKITNRTKAIVVVDLAGQAAALDEIMTLAKRHGIYVIEDCAQSPGALYKKRTVGTVAHMGVYSLNCHKIIQTGEGGVVVTNDSELALRLRLIRNHAEAVVGGMDNPPPFLQEFYGGNYRMTEVLAAIGRAQLKKLPRLIRERQDRVAYLNRRLKEIPGLRPPKVRPQCTHVYYIQMIHYDSKRLGVARDVFVKALAAEGVSLRCGYIKPLYREPFFKRFRRNGSVEPVVERLYQDEIVVNHLFYPPLSHKDLDDVANAIEKVMENIPALKNDTGKAQQPSKIN